MDAYEMKRRAFEEAVKRCSEQQGIRPPPEVSITEDPCPLFPGGTAHVHVKRVICVWKGRLEALTLKEINEEVARLLGGGRGQKQTEHLPASGPAFPCSKAVLLLLDFARERGLLAQGKEEREVAKPQGPENQKKKSKPPLARENTRGGA